MESSFQLLSLIDQNEINSDDFYYTTFSFSKKNFFLYYVFNNHLNLFYLFSLIKYFSSLNFLISSLFVTQQILDP